MGILFLLALALLIFLASKRQQKPNTKSLLDFRSSATTIPPQAKPGQRHAHKPSPKSVRHTTNGTEHAPPPPIPTSRQLKGKAWVIDGDTILVSKIKVRLAGIDAPELDQPWGKKAKWEMVKICKGQVIDVELTGETSYDRLVGTCYLSDKTDIGAKLIEAGLALDGGHFSRGKYRHLEPEGIRKKLKFYGHWR